MGFLSEIKKLFWVKKAVAKSAADKAADKVQDIAGDLSHKASDAWSQTKDFAEDLGDKLNKQPQREPETDWIPKEKSRDINTESTAHKLGEKLGDAAGKIGDAAGKTWDKAKEEGKELLDKAVETSDKVWEKAEDVTEDLWAKAKDAAQKAGEKFQEGVDSMLEKAKELDKKIEEETDKIDANRDGWADKPVNEKLREHESTLKGKDDFFERAQRYSEGDYSMGKPVVIPRDDDPGEEGMTPLPPLPKEDIADDAILDDDDK